MAMIMEISVGREKGRVRRRGEGREKEGKKE